MPAFGRLSGLGKFGARNSRGAGTVLFGSSRLGAKLTRIKVQGFRSLFSKGPPIVLRTSGIATFNTKFIKGKNWQRINETPLKRAGLYARRVMINSIRKDTSKSQRPSRPGKPPKSRAPGHPFRLIYSVPDTRRGRVTIGHVGFRPADPHTAMEVNEFGLAVRILARDTRRRGMRRVRDKRSKTKMRYAPTSKKQKEAARRLFLAGRIKSAGQQGMQKRLVKYPPRPFAQPALEKTKQRMPDFWRNSVKSSTVSR